MPPPTNTERIGRLEPRSEGLNVRLDGLNVGVASLTERQGKADERLAALER